MRSIFLNNRKRPNAVAAIDDDSEYEEYLLRQSQCENFSIQDIDTAAYHGDVENQARAYIHCFDQLTQQQQYEQYASLFERIDSLQIQTYIHLLLKYSTKNDAAVYFSRIIGILDRYLAQEDPTAKRRSYKLIYNIYFDYDSVVEKQQLNHLVEQQMLHDIIHTQDQSVQRIIIQVERMRVYNESSSWAFMMQIVYAYMPCQHLLKYINSLLTKALGSDDAGELLIQTKEVFDRIISMNITYLRYQVVYINQFSSFLQLLQAYYQTLNRYDVRFLANLLALVLEIYHMQLSKLYLYFLESALKQIPLVEVVRNFDQSLICEMMKLLSVPDLQEAVLDVFICVQTSYDPYWQWFSDICLVNVSNENIAYAVAIALEDFLEMDEAFWSEMRMKWSRVREQLGRYSDQQDFIQRVIQGFYLREM